MFTFTKLSLARQFMIISFLVLLGQMVMVGFWVGRQIEMRVMNRTAAMKSLYIESYLSPHLQSLSHADQLSSAQLTALNHLLSATLVEHHIVSFQIWGRDGQILYSPDPAMINRQFGLNDRLTRAFDGDVQAKISALDKPEHTYERRFGDKLIETYVPIRVEGGGDVIAVAIFYQAPDELLAEIGAAQWHSWLVVGATTLTIYLLLAGLVGKASHTIRMQQTNLEAHVNRLRKLLAQNKGLHNQVRRAASRTTALNERFLSRISADLHDGPGQDLALALLRIESVMEHIQSGPSPLSTDIHTVHSALNSALTEVRAISAGLRLPELCDLSPAETACRAIRDYERKTNCVVNLSFGQMPGNLPISVKITLYRILQEALSNSYRHAGAAGQIVRLEKCTNELFLEVADTGPGFDPANTSANNGRLGLAGMRERVRILGGRFDLQSAPGQGVSIKAYLPLIIPEEDDVRAYSHLDC